MWDCGSARFCVCVVAGTGVSMCAAPEYWLMLALAGGMLLLLCRKNKARGPTVPGVSRTSGMSRPCGLRSALSDLSAAALLVSGVAFLASERISADSSRVERVEGTTVTLRGVVSGFPQPARKGGSVLVKVVEIIAWPERAARPDAGGARLAADALQNLASVGSGVKRTPSLSTLAKVLVRLKHRVDEVAPGDTLLVTGVIRNSLAQRNPGGFSEAAYLFQQGIWYVLDVPGYLRPVLVKPGTSRGLTSAYLAPVHEWIRREVNRRMSGEERAFLLALILGERGEFSEETKVAFRDSGLVHILSVSGLHTALVGLAAVILLRGAGLRERTALVGSAAVVWFYCGLSGFQPPTLRSAFMLSWMIASRLTGRSGELFGPLCSSCAVLLLINPRYFWDSGFQLSYVATGSIIASARLARHVRQSVKMPEWAWKYVGSTALTTCVAQLGVLPILALQFGSVSMVAVPANLLGIPLASGALVFSFCSLAVAAVFPWAASWAFDATWLLLRLCNLVAGTAASLPCAALELSRPHVLEVVAFLACFFVALGLVSRGAVPLSGRARTRAGTATPTPTPTATPTPAPVAATGAATEAGMPEVTKTRRRVCLSLAISCLALLLLRFLGVNAAALIRTHGWRGAGVRQCADWVEVDFLDVGQGDAVVIRSDAGNSAVVDAGDSREEWDAGERVLVPYLRAKGLRSAGFGMVTHFHSDHAGGFISLIEKGKVNRVARSGADTSSSYVKLVSEACRKHGVRVLTLHAPAAYGSELAFSVRVFHPTGATTADTSSASVNDSSLVCVVEFADVRFILPGDVGSAILDVLADSLRSSLGSSAEGRENGRPIVTVLKAPHHGAAATLSYRFAESVRPDYVLFSVGKGNRFGHPSADVVECYSKTGARLFRTDLDGCVTFRVSVRDARERRQYERRTSVFSGQGPRSLSVTVADPRASHPFIRKAKRWRAERALRALTLLSLVRGGWHDSHHTGGE